MYNIREYFLKYLQPVQALNLSILVVVGHYLAYLYLPLWEIALWVIYGLGVEHLLVYLRRGRVRYLSYSSLSTVFGVMLMTVAFHWWIYAVVIFVALLQKHILRIEGRHLFNPSNAALIVLLLFFPDDGGVVFGQLGDTLWFASAVMIVGAVILWVADRWMIPLIFSISYLVLQYLLIVGYDPTIYLDDIYWRFASVSFVVFLFYMLTDPRTTPLLHKMQAFFGVGIATVATLLDLICGYRLQHLFVALFVLSGLRILAWNTVDIRVKTVLVFVLIVAIISIESHPPIYFAMDG